MINTVLTDTEKYIFFKIIKINNFYLYSEYKTNIIYHSKKISKFYFPFIFNITYLYKKNIVNHILYEIKYTYNNLYKFQYEISITKITTNPEINYSINNKFDKLNKIKYIQRDTHYIYIRKTANIYTYQRNRFFNQEKSFEYEKNDIIIDITYEICQKHTSLILFIILNNYLSSIYLNNLIFLHKIFHNTNKTEENLRIYLNNNT